MNRTSLGEIDIFLQDESGSSSASTMRYRAESISEVVSSSSPRSPRNSTDDILREVGAGDASQRTSKAVCDLGHQLVPPSTISGRKILSQYSHLKTQADWEKHLEQVINNADGKGEGGQSKRKRRGPTSVPISSFAYGRTPRGVPLLVSPLSQFEDRYMGATYGGPQGISLYSGKIPSQSKYK